MNKAALSEIMTPAVVTVAQDVTIAGVMAIVTALLALNHVQVIPVVDHSSCLNMLDFLRKAE